MSAFDCRGEPSWALAMAKLLLAENISDVVHDAAGRALMDACDAGDEPPTLILHNGDGGVIIEWRYDPVVRELEIFADGSHEFTRFESGKVVEMRS